MTDTDATGELVIEDRPAGRAVEWISDGFDDSDALSEPVDLSIPQTESPRPVPEGVADPERDETVIAARASYERLAAQLRTVATERAAIEGKLGIPANATQRDLQRVANDLLMRTGDVEGLEVFQRVAAREKLLRAATAKAADAVRAALVEARRRGSAAAWQVLFDPAARKVALAFVALLAARAEEITARAAIQGAGFHEPGGVVGGQPDADPIGPNHTVGHLMRAGWLTAEEVRAAVPSLLGVPGC